MVRRVNVKRMPVIPGIYLYGIIIPDADNCLPAMREYGMMPTEATMLATFRTFRDPWEAHLFRTRLEADGIPSFVVFDQHVSVNWPLSTALGGVQVQIPVELTLEAQDVVRRCLDGEYRAELEDIYGPLDMLACPKCGSVRIKRHPYWQQVLFGLSLALLFGAAMRLETLRFSCKACGASWRADKDNNVHNEIV